MKKTPAVAYMHYKINYTPRKQLAAELEDAPLRDDDRKFICDIYHGLSYKELAEKYHKSLARVYQWKRSLYEKLCRYFRQKVK